MARKKNSREKKPALKVKDLAASQNPQGGDTTARYNLTNAWPSKVSGASLTTSTDTTLNKK